MRIDDDRMAMRAVRDVLEAFDVAETALPRLVVRQPAPTQHAILELHGALKRLRDAMPALEPGATPDADGT
jgi:hypothetical protein